jgi:hypothetical protein
LPWNARSEFAKFEAFGRHSRVGEAALQADARIRLAAGRPVRQADGAQ